MHTVNTNNNVVALQVTQGATILNLTTSLQRHHFNFCAEAGALAVNSLIFSIIPQSGWELDAGDVGTAIDLHLTGGLPPAGLYDLDVVTSSGRTYRVDNSARNALNPVNHFYPIAGTSLWAAMNQQQYQMARALRRIQVAIEARRAEGEAQNKVAAYSDFKSLIERKASIDKDRGAANNPVLSRYQEAVIEWRTNAADAFRAQLDEVSGDRVLVGLVKGLLSKW